MITLALVKASLEAGINLAEVEALVDQYARSCMSVALRGKGPFTVAAAKSDGPAFAAAVWDGLKARGFTVEVSETGYEAKLSGW